MSTSNSKPPVINDASRAALVHNVSIGAVVLCPILIALPPRKLDIYTIALLSGTFMGGNHLTREYTGRSIIARVQNSMQRVATPSLPPKALEIQARLREEKIRREIPITVDKEEAPQSGIAEALRRQEEARKERGLIEKVWMGSEGDDWKAKRDQREREALEEGRGYGGLIMDQIWEVWNWGKDKNEEVKEIDKKVVEARKEGKS